VTTTLITMLTCLSVTALIVLALDAAQRRSRRRDREIVRRISRHLAQLPPRQPW
jgi:hypothetical protein